MKYYSFRKMKYKYVNENASKNSSMELKIWLA